MTEQAVSPSLGLKTAPTAVRQASEGRIRGTQNERILAHLMIEGPLTALEALELCGCMRLSERIRELKKAGYAITSSMVKVPSGKRVAEYRLG